MGPPRRRRPRRVRDPRARDPRDPRPSGPAIHPVAHARCCPARRLPGVARARDGPAREFRGIRDRAPRHGHEPRRPAGVRHGPVRLPGPHRRPRVQPALHAARGVRGGRDVRAAPVRVQGDRGRRRFRPDLPGLAAHGWQRGAAPHRPDERPRPPPLGRGAGRAHRGGDRDRRVAHAAHPSDARAHRGRGRRALRHPGGHRRRPGPDPAGALDPDPAPRACGGHLGAHGRPHRGELLHRAGGLPVRRAAREAMRRRAPGRVAPGAIPSEPTSR